MFAALPILAMPHAAPAVAHPLNWTVGWALVLAAFLIGALVGLNTHRDDFLGGYASFPRRMVRLGHIALAALGIVNLLFALSPAPSALPRIGAAASGLWIAGAILMPIVCFLSAWRKPLRLLFPLPVAALIAAVVLTLIGGLL